MEKSWICALKKYKEGKHHKTPAEMNKETDGVFLKLLKEEQKIEEEKEPSYKTIPKFFYKKPSNKNLLYFRVRQEARTRFLQIKKSEELNKKDLTILWHILKENISPPEDGTDRINYDQFVSVSRMLDPKWRQFFSPSTFLKFERDEYGRIEISQFFQYVVRKTNLLQLRLNISLYDSNGYGYLNENDLQNYIFDLIQTFPQFQDIQENFYLFYVLTAVRKFFFFLDPKCTGKILIKDLMTSQTLAELFEWKQEWLISENNMNWFSYESSIQIYKKYIELDTDKNGMLNKEELINYTDGLTKIFIDRLFEEYQTYEGEMDYNNYLKFALAMENKNTPQAIKYFWKVLDVYNKGAIDTFVINMFVRDIIEMFDEKDKFHYKVDDIRDEIWDIIKPENPKFIAYQDLINWGEGGKIIGMLIDAISFYEYNQRETTGTDDLADSNNDEK